MLQRAKATAWMKAIHPLLQSSLLQWFPMGPTPVKTAHSHGGLHSHLIHGSLGPPKSAPNGLSISSNLFSQGSQVTVITLSHVIAKLRVAWTYPALTSRTKRYQSFTNFGLLHYQLLFKLNWYPCTVAFWYYYYYYYYYYHHHHQHTDRQTDIQAQRLTTLLSVKQQALSLSMAVMQPNNNDNTNIEANVYTLATARVLWFIWSMQTQHLVNWCKNNTQVCGMQALFQCFISVTSTRKQTSPVVYFTPVQQNCCTLTCSHCVSITTALDIWQHEDEVNTSSALKPSLFAILLLHKYKKILQKLFKNDREVYSE